MIGEADGHEQCTEAKEAQDAIALAEVAQVVEEGLGDGEDQQDERLPADEGRALPEADGQQSGSVEHQEGGDGEGLLEVGLGVVEGGVVPEEFELADDGENGDEVEGDDGGASDLEPGGE